MKQILSLLIGLILISCGVSAHRGNLKIVSTKPVDNRFVALSETMVEGKACFGTASLVTGLPMTDNVIERAIADALSKYEGATYLLNVSFYDEGKCIYAKGIPAKEKQGSTQ